MFRTDIDKNAWRLCLNSNQMRIIIIALHFLGRHTNNRLIEEYAFNLHVDLRNAYIYKITDKSLIDTNYNL